MRATSLSYIYIYVVCMLQNQIVETSILKMSFQQVSPIVDKLLEFKSCVWALPLNHTSWFTHQNQRFLQHRKFNTYILRKLSSICSTNQTNIDWKRDFGSPLYVIFNVKGNNWIWVSNNKLELTCIRVIHIYVDVLKLNYDSSIILLV